MRSISRGLRNNVCRHGHVASILATTASSLFFAVHGVVQKTGCSPIIFAFYAGLPARPSDFVPGLRGTLTLGLMRLRRHKDRLSQGSTCAGLDSRIGAMSSWESLSGSIRPGRKTLACCICPAALSTPTLLRMQLFQFLSQKELIMSSATMGADHVSGLEWRRSLALRMWWGQVPMLHAPYSMSF